MRIFVLLEGKIMRAFLFIVNGIIGVTSLSLTVIVFGMMIITGYEGYTLPRDAYHFCFTVGSVGILTTLNMIYLRDKV